MRTMSPSRAPARASARSTPIVAQPVLHVLHRLEVGEVGHGHDALGVAPGDPPRAVVVAHAREPLLHRAAARRSGSGSGSAAAGLADQRAEPTEELVEALAGDGGELDAVRFGERVAELEEGDVGLGADDEARPVEQLGPVAAQLVEQDPRLLLGRPLVDRREVEQQDQHPGPLDVAEELVTRGRVPRPRPR